VSGHPAHNNYASRTFRYMTTTAELVQTNTLLLTFVSVTTSHNIKLSQFLG